MLIVALWLLALKFLILEFYSCHVWVMSKYILLHTDSHVTDYCRFFNTSLRDRWVVRHYSLMFLSASRFLWGREGEGVGRKCIHWKPSSSSLDFNCLSRDSLGLFYLPLLIFQFFFPIHREVDCFCILRSYKALEMFCQSGCFQRRCISS